MLNIVHPLACLEIKESVVLLYLNKHKLPHMCLFHFKHLFICKPKNLNDLSGRCIPILESATPLRCNSKFEWVVIFFFCGLNRIHFGFFYIE